MRKKGILVVLFGLVVVSVNQVNAADALDRAIKQVNGTWKVVSQVRDGAEVSENDFSDHRLLLEDGKWTAYKGQELIATGTYKLVGLEKDYMKYDVTNETGKNAGMSYTDISKVEGDVLTICIAPTGKERPTAFESKPGSGNRLTVYKREKR